MGFKIKETDKEIYRMIYIALLNDVNEHLLNAARRAKPRVHDYMRTVFKQSPTYLSLLNGDLVGVFGFPNDSQKRVEAILDRIISSMKIMFYKSTKINPDYTFNGGIRVHILQSDYEDILSLTEATINTGQDMLPWLSWMLKEGNEYIDKEWKIIFRKGAGRSGQAIMEKVTKNPGWRIEVPHAGTPDNNWLTRALFDNIETIKEQFLRIFEEELNR